MDSKLEMKSEATNEIPQYDVKFEELESKTMRFKSRWRNISVAGFQIRLTRRFTPILINIYLPCMMLILVSFNGFVIPDHMIPGRMALLVTIFLMLVNIGNSEKIMGSNVINNFGIKYLIRK